MWLCIGNKADFFLYNILVLDSVGPSVCGVRYSAGRLAREQLWRVSLHIRKSISLRGFCFLSGASLCLQPIICRSRDGEETSF